MVSFGKRNAKSLGINVLRRIPALLGCLLFLFSFISPFYHFTSQTQIEAHYSIYYWSFKSEVQIYELSHFAGLKQYWFFDYWLNSFSGWNLGLEWMLISMLAAQILTIASSIASVIANRRVPALAAIVSCLATTALMIYVNTRIYNASFYLNSYEQGYWLTYPSMFLFITASALNEMPKRNKHRSTEHADLLNGASK
jgi:hypothetical protein